VNRRPGQVKVTVESGYCSFCDRTRNLRREEHHLGALVRTIVTCETCHRTLSSSIGVATPEPVAPAPAPVAASAEAPVVKTKPAAKRTPAKKAPAKRAAKTPKRPAKPTSTATRRVTKEK
jgi:hypothetical protein